MLVRLVFNSRPQVICPPWPPKCFDYRREPPCPEEKKSILYLLIVNLYLFLFKYLKHVEAFEARLRKAGVLET